ncbi:MAG: LptF/LptG family permease [Treponema sp.]|nr:LptF/LptG family permease [Treponema sp.]
MKFVGYILKKVIPFCFVSLIFIALILNLVDLFMNISKYLEMEAPAKDVLMVMIYYIPKTVWYAGPIAFLFSVTYVLSDLYSKNEMEAIFASGVSLFRFVLPVFVFAIILSVGMFYLEDKLVVTNMEKKNALQKYLLDEVESANNENIVVLSDSAKVVYKAKRYRDSLKRLDNVFFVFRDDEKSLKAIIHAQMAVWNEDTLQWDLDGAVQFEMIDGELKRTALSDTYKSQLTESYEIFRRTTVDVATVNVADAKVYINHLKKAGLPYNEQLSVYYKKFSFPFILFIAAFLAVGVTGKTRKNVLLISLSLSIVAVVLFYVFQMVTMVLAKTGVMTPFMGAWLPDIVFLFIAGILLKFSRT